MRNKFLVSLVIVASAAMLFGCQPKTTPTESASSVTTPAVTTTTPAAIKTGDSVLAIWAGDTWYLGTVDTACSMGFNVKWSDGTGPTCTAPSEMVPDKSLTKEEVVVGKKLFAKWGDLNFYKAEITAVNGDNYSVKYYDGFTKDNLTLADLRVQP